MKHSLSLRMRLSTGLSVGIFFSGDRFAPSVGIRLSKFVLAFRCPPPNLNRGQIQRFETDVSQSQRFAIESTIGCSNIDLVFDIPMNYPTRRAQVKES